MIPYLPQLAGLGTALYSFNHISKSNTQASGLDSIYSEVESIKAQIDETSTELRKSQMQMQEERYLFAAGIEHARGVQAERDMSANLAHSIGKAVVSANSSGFRSSSKSLAIAELATEGERKILAEKFNTKTRTSQLELASKITGLHKDSLMPTYVPAPQLRETYEKEIKGNWAMNFLSFVSQNPVLMPNFDFSKVAETKPKVEKGKEYGKAPRLDGSYSSYDSMVTSTYETDLDLYNRQTPIKVEQSENSIYIPSQFYMANNTNFDIISPTGLF